MPSMLWFRRAIPETLPPARRRAFTPAIIIDGVRQVCASRVSVVHMLVMGLVGGPFIGYLGTARHIYQDIIQCR